MPQRIAPQDPGLLALRLYQSGSENHTARIWYWGRAIRRRYGRRGRLDAVAQASYRMWLWEPPPHSRLHKNAVRRQVLGELPWGDLRPCVARRFLMWGGWNRELGQARIDGASADASFGGGMRSLEPRTNAYAGTDSDRDGHPHAHAYTNPYAKPHARPVQCHHVQRSCWSGTRDRHSGRGGPSHRVQVQL